MSRFAPATDTSSRGGVSRRTFEMSCGTRERQSQRHQPSALAQLDDQTAADRSYGRSTARGWVRQAQLAAI